MMSMNAAMLNLQNGGKGVGSSTQISASNVITKPMTVTRSSLAAKQQHEEQNGRNNNGIKNDKSLLDETFSNSTDEASSTSTSSDDVDADACCNSYASENEYENEEDYEDDAISKTMHEALAIAMRTLGEDHCRVNCILLHIAAMHRDRREYEESVDYFQRALKLAKKRLGPDHPDVARILVNMGSVYRKDEKLEDAIRCFMQALDLFEAAGVPGQNYHVALTLRICKRVSFELSDSMRRNRLGQAQ
mmetsp:Transcript_24089/g.37173  ORF Transcript_24089/g.37173 Transcript_24089/m.37173 type:complete len:247 (-) Transcript_24089:295-1035(-)|eukprot:CAMPEP_0196802928 /NCGR_PEP_ID=MMETSP1362-20130617/2433_1 /TAXON_ID=163516 /ORGANISM="Leptocylindrus danicus, Strain CCMP1856" /LENGTH=246 /DNA_ID=CAMNT_0042174345 /DNA_START=62 /DNA_END=802 /DNA_ORIENTATION=+